MTDEDDVKMYVYFNITNLGQTNSITYNCEYDTPWQEVLDKLVGTLEAHYGYGFNLKELGIYNSDKS